MADFLIPAEPDFKWKSKMADLLLDCPSLGDLGARALTVRQLSKNLRSAVQYAPVQNARQDIFNLIDTCLNYPDGLIQLVKIVNNFDEGTIPVEKLTKFLTPLRVFLSYKRDLQPDEGLALSLHKELSRNYSVFIDQRDIPIGEDWANRLRNELQKADFMIALLSEHSIKSEMLEGELRLAHTSGKPTILPVRMAYREPFRNPLDIYLNRRNWALWDGPQDTPTLLADLENAMSGATLPLSAETFEFTQFELPTVKPVAGPVLDLEEPGGTMSSDSPFYVMRPDDEQAIRLARRVGRGETITIKGARQMGKSSLLMRVIEAGQEVGKQVVFVDFQLFERTALNNPEQFYRQFCALLSDGLDIDNRSTEYWQTDLGLTQRCTRYVQRYLLKQATGPIMLAMDEVETMLDTSFRSDFFGMLRSWHNNRAPVTLKEWRRLDLVMVTSTEPYQLIDNLKQSPFNVGETFKAVEFEPTQLGQLNEQHGQTLTAEQLTRLYERLGGHPFLTRRAFYLVATGRLTTSELFGPTTTRNDGPFGDHLRNHLFRLSERPELKLAEAMRAVLRDHKCSEDSFFRLESAGLVRSEGQLIYPRCKLYEDYFREHL